MMRGVITDPKRIITGAFTLLFSFWRDVDLTMADIRVETLEGDALGHSKDNFGGSGSNYHLLCYLPDARAGKSRFSVTKAGVDVEPVTVEYDTVKTVHATFGTPAVSGKKVEIPISFDIPIQRLRKTHFRTSLPIPCQLYGGGDAYQLVLSPLVDVFSVSIKGTVEKSNGIKAAIVERTLEVDRGTLG